MRVLIFDPFHGAAGDMIVGGLLDCGADRGQVIRAMASVVGEPVVSTVTRCGIKAISLKTRATPAHRTLHEILVRCEQADAPVEVVSMAKRVFARIGAAEERVHGSHTHFHEVGADDAVADVIGACTALHSLGVDGVAVLPVTMGRGTSKGAHGTYPVPAPATVCIFEGTNIATRLGGEEGELCTPTGAALLAEFVTLQEGDLGSYEIKAVGYGAGTSDPQNTPNVLRAMLIETAPGMLKDSVVMLETNVDDVSGEVIANAITRFMDAGARDATAIPCIMKKGRPGYRICVICTEDKSADFGELMARELGSLGIRCTPAVHRFIADRTTEEVEVTFHGHHRRIPVKFGWLGGTVYTLKAEFEPARTWAADLDVPVRVILQAVAEAGWQSVRKKQGGAKDEK